MLKQPFILITIVSIWLLSIGPVAHANSEQGIEYNHFIYTPDDMLNFDVASFVNDNMPGITPHTEEIQHWSAYSSISPKILISLFSYHSPDAKLEKLTPKQLHTALSTISGKSTLNEQIKDISYALSTAYYQALDQNEKHPEAYALNTLLASRPSSEPSSSKAHGTAPEGQETGFSTVYFELFPTQNQPTLTSPNNKTLPSVGLLQLPYPIGQSWQTWGGTHSNSGTNSGPKSSLDFRLGRLNFGADTSNIWVASAINGRVVRHSSCFVEVIGDNGWSTGYYHLDNIVVSSGQRISRNTRLSNYADNKPQSLCQGGSSNGPHVHFSLKRNGAHFSLDQVLLSGYKVTEGRRDYDTDCNHFYLVRDGRRVCNGAALLNNGATQITSPEPDLRVTNATPSSSRLKIGQRFSIAATVLNAGQSDSSSTQLNFVIADQAQLQSTDNALGNLAIKPLAPNESRIETATLLAPTVPGTYWVGACVATIPEELNASNNCSPGSVLTTRKINVVLPHLLLFPEEQP